MLQKIEQAADLQDEEQDGDLSPPWSEVVVVPKNLTTFVLKDLPPGQSILPPQFPGTKFETLEVFPPNGTQCSIPTRASLQCARLHTPQESIVQFQGKLRKICCILAEGQSAGSAGGSEMPGN